MADVIPGVYLHFKGNRYEVIASALHSETHEEFVLYRPLNGDSTLWARPKSMFFEPVWHKGEEVPGSAY